MRFRTRRSRLVAVALPYLLAACATTRREVLVTQCPSDPPTKSLLCVKPDGSEYSEPWELSGGDQAGAPARSHSKRGYMCLPMDDYLELFKEVNSK